MKSIHHEKFVHNYKDSMVSVDHSIKDGLAAISKSGALIAVIVDKDEKLLGIFTDSDARRALLSGASLSDKIGLFMKTDPVVASWRAKPEELKDLALEEKVREIPLINDDGQFVDVFVTVTHENRATNSKNVFSVAPKSRLTNSMFLVAGGKGTRLRPVVNDRPKPLAIVGDRPIIQTIIENAVQCGINKFFVSVNYKAELIVEHLNLPIYKNLEIECLHETQFLGTAGSLSLLGEKWTEPLVVANADLLTNIALDRIIRHHVKTNAAVTCVVRAHHEQIPFGVVDVENEKIVKIKEKPTNQYLVNSGIYVLSPTVQSYMKNDEVLDMPNLISRVLEAKQAVVPFLMHEYWRDIGRPEEYAIANDEYNLIFGDKPK